MVCTVCIVNKLNGDYVMKINLSEEMIETIYNALRDTKNHKLTEYQKEKDKKKKEIIDKRITEVEKAIEIFSQLMDEIVFGNLLKNCK